jgi:type I restriction enzyme, S subunit
VTRAVEFELPASWQWIPLERVCTPIRGITFPSTESAIEPFDGGVACLTTSAVQDEVEWNSRRFVPLARLSKPEQFLQINDILISTANSKVLVGKSCLVYQLPFECTFGAFVTVFRPNEAIEPYFLAQWLRTPAVKDFFYKMSSETTNISNLRVGELLALEIPFPLPLEQRRITEILRWADDLRRLRRQANGQAKELLPALFNEMFGDPATNPKGWSVVELDEVFAKDRASVQTGPFGSALKKNEYVESGIPVWGINNIHENEFVEEGSLFITEAKYQGLREYSVESGDVLISRAGTVGRMCVARPHQRPSIIGTNLVRVALDHSMMTPEYLTTIFTFFPNSLGSLRASSDDTAYSFVNPKVLRSLKMPLPPLALQEEFVQCLKQIRETRAQQVKSEFQFNTLFQSLLAQAFSGELTSAWRETHREEVEFATTESASKLADQQKQQSSSYNAIKLFGPPIVKAMGAFFSELARQLGLPSSLNELLQEIRQRRASGEALDKIEPVSRLRAMVPSSALRAAIFAEVKTLPRYWTLSDLAQGEKEQLFSRNVIREAVDMLVVMGQVRKAYVRTNDPETPQGYVEAYTLVRDEELIKADEIEL